jgi:hypothetical protein
MKITSREISSLEFLRDFDLIKEKRKREYWLKDKNSIYDGYYLVSICEEKINSRWKIIAVTLFDLNTGDIIKLKKELWKTLPIK